MYPITHSKFKKKMAEIEHDRQEDCRDICSTPFELGEKDVTDECMDCDLVEECVMGSGSEELIGSW